MRCSKKIKKLPTSIIKVKTNKLWIECTMALKTVLLKHVDYKRNQQGFLVPACILTVGKEVGVKQ